MHFKKFPSLYNVTHTKSITYFLNKFPELREQRYVLLEKIHGANIQFAFTPEGQMRVASQNRWIDPGDSFYGVLDEMITILPVLTMMKEDAYQCKSTIRLYGEFFGANIQKGVDYGEEKRFRFFGARYNEDNIPTYWVPYQMLKLQFQDAGLEDYLAPEVAIVKGLAGAVEYDCSNQTNLGEGIMEGVTIQPYADHFPYDGSLFWLKKKNPEFIERVEKRKPKKAQAVATKVMMLHSVFKEYICNMRMQALFSKEGPIEDQSQLGKYIPMLVADAREDFLRDYPAVGEMDKKDRKYIMNGGAAAAQLLKGEL